MRFVTIVFFVWIFHSKVVAQCIQPYSWASWTTTENEAVDGFLFAGDRDIKIRVTTNYPIYKDKEIYNLSKFIEFSEFATISKTAVPRVSWSVNGIGKTEICFSEPVLNPALLLSSLGDNGKQVKLTFSQPYSVVFQGFNTDFVDNYSLIGKEGYSIIMFPGTFSCLTIESKDTEFFTNFNLGLRVSAFPIKIAGPTSACGVSSLSASGGATYRWSGGSTPDKAINTVDQSGMYTVVATDDKGCTAYATKSVTVVAGNPPIVGSNETSCLLTGGTVLDAGTEQSGLTYNWLNSTNTDRSLLAVNPGRYDVIVTNPAGCTAVRTLTVISPPSVSLEPSKKICVNEQANLSPLISGMNAYTYQWSSGETTKTIRVSQPGVYSVVVSDGYCSTSAITNLIVDPLPIVPPDETVCYGKVLSAGSQEAGVTYLWANRGETTPDIGRQPEGVYAVTVTNGLGCSVVRTITVAGICTPQVLAPNAFTPNGDGVNEVFSPMLVNGEMAQLTVYNRWGVLIYDEVSNRPQWDGRLYSADQATGTYTYRLAYKTLGKDELLYYQGTLLLLK